MSITDDDLMRAWHSNDSQEEASEKLGISIHRLCRAWRQLQYAGMLPQGPRRYTKAEPERSINTGVGDLLLARLNKAHGGKR